MPTVAAVNEGFWRAAAEGRLDVQRCRECGAHRFPPRDGCHRCGSMDWSWDTIAGTGTVYTYVWVPDRERSAETSREAFYNVVVVDLDGVEGGPVRIVSNVLDAWERDDLEVGQRVQLECVRLTDDVGLACFVRAGGDLEPGGAGA